MHAGAETHLPCSPGHQLARLEPKGTFLYSDIARAHGSLSDTHCAVLRVMAPRAPRPHGRMAIASRVHRDLGCLSQLPDSMTHVQVSQDQRPESTRLEKACRLC